MNEILPFLKEAIAPATGHYKVADRTRVIDATSEFQEGQKTVVMWTNKFQAGRLSSTNLPSI
ncbi:hypothetical protein OK016_09580 [Vibrio chagasii]|nr:hypothetical protein [Vibrio chagasii]